MNEAEKVIHVLMIDDDEDEYVITQDLFVELGPGYKLSWVGEYERGLDEITKPEYDACLLDFHLGARTGLDFLAEAVSRNCTLPVIFLTGQGDYAVDLAAMKAGASDFLDKGEFTPRSLERSLRYAMERKRNEERIRFLAYYDQLTHLPNRTLFYDRLKTSFATAKRHERMCAVMFLDIDNFKRINDTLGHSLGDLLIREVADRLRSCIRKEDTVCHDDFSAMLDTVARLGGDEFTVLLSEIRETTNPSVVAERIRRALLAPIVLENHHITMTVSIGIAVFPADGNDIETVLKHADIAMYNAKMNGKDNFQYFNTMMNSTALERLTREQELRKALEADEFELYYQPLIELKTERVVGSEALIRWRHPVKGIIPPMDFLPIAEEIGLIYDLGDRVFEILRRDLAACRKQGLEDVVIAMNVSPRQLKYRNLPSAVAGFLADTGLDPGLLTMEITENCIIDNVEEAEGIIAGIRGMGLRIALDDFGAGYSSFVLLRRIKIDILKIDRSLVARLPEHTGDATIVASLCSIAHSMDVRVVAEGIENRDQLDFMKTQACEWGQGFYFHKPLPREEYAALLARRGT